MSKKVAVIMGSDSDWPVVKGACTQLEEFGIPYEAHILSAHRTPAAAAEFSARRILIEILPHFSGKINRFPQMHGKNGKRNKYFCFFQK